MPRGTGKPRRLVVGEDAFLWSVAHSHQDAGCRETLRLRRSGSRGCLMIVFQEGPGHRVPDGFLPSGAVGTGDAWLNLHKPGTVRRLLEEAIARGWRADDPGTVHLDGWLLFTAAGVRPSALPSSREP